MRFYGFSRPIIVSLFNRRIPATVPLIIHLLLPLRFNLLQDEERDEL